MEPDVKILRAGPEHAGEVARLNDTVQRMHAEHHPDIFKYPTDAAEMEAFFRDKISADGSFLFVATLAGRAVGYLWCVIERKEETVFNHERSRVYVHQLSVEPHCQRQGVGRQLMHAVTDLARRNGIGRLMLDSWTFNKGAQRFFSKLGFSRFNSSMWRQVEAD